MRLRSVAADHAAPTLIGNAAAAPFFGRFGPAAADADWAAAAAAATLTFFLPLASAGVLICAAAAGIFEVRAPPLSQRLPKPAFSPFLAFVALPRFRTAQCRRRAGLKLPVRLRRLHF